MRRRSLVLLLAVGCGPAAATPVAPPGNRSADAPASTLTGRYTLTHEVEMMSGDCGDAPCVERVTDTLAVTEHADGTLGVAVQLVQTNGHSCGFDGTLVGRATAPVEAATPRWDYVAPADGDDAPCALSLTFDGDALTLSADGCRYYCGARASLDASFAYPPGDPDPGDAPPTSD